MFTFALNETHLTIITLNYAETVIYGHICY